MVSIQLFFVYIFFFFVFLVSKRQKIKDYGVNENEQIGYRALTHCYSIIRK